MSKLDDYAKNPDANLTEEEVEAMLSEMDDAPAEPEPVAETAGDVEKDPPGDGTDDEARKGEEDQPQDAPKEAPKAGEKEQPKEDDKPQQVIKTRDGKHEIPYSVLEVERRRVADLQRQLDEERAKARPETQTPPQQKDQDAGTSADTDDFDLEAYREEFGDEEAKIEQKRRERVAKLEARQAELEAEIAANRKWREDQEAARKQSVESEINEAIDSIDELREWRDKGDPMWDAAVALDNRLMQDPAFQDKSFRDRFETVVERLTGKKPRQENNSQDLEKDVERKLAEKERDQRTAPNSLTDLPGGNVTDQSEHDTLDRLSTTQLEAKLAKMTPDEQEAYLARL